MSEGEPPRRTRLAPVRRYPGFVFALYAKILAMRDRVVLATSCLLWLLPSSLSGHLVSAIPVQTESSAFHTLFGDIRVDEGGADVRRALSFSVILQTTAGMVIGRDSVPANGRFRFHRVPNGEYVLIVELGNDVVAREQFLLYESRSTDVRRDIELVWNEGGVPGAESGTVYARSGPADRMFKEAQRESAGGDLRKAASLLERIVKDDSGDYEAWTELGTVNARRERNDDAQKAYVRALEIRADFLPALVNLGKLHLSRSRFADAVDPLTRAVEAEPGRAETHRLLGEAYLGIRKGSEAVPHLYEAIRLDPEGMAEVHLRLAQLYDLAGMKDRAAREYVDFLGKRPDSPRRAELEKYIAENRGS
jgi:Flp pilus assembly protein TadD